MARLRTVCVLAFAIALPTIFASAASAASVTPTVVAGNPNCATLNADNANFPSITSNFGFKIENGGQNAVPNGVYQLTDADGELTGGAPSDTGNTVTISNSNGTVFDWASTLTMDAVIVKGGDAGNVYVYSPEAASDAGLLSPTKNGGTPALSHVEFCYDYPGLDVTKTANTSFKRTWTWDIDKSGDQTSGGPLSPGQAFNVNYDVVVSALSADTDHAVAGTITVTNPSPTPTQVSSVTDQLSDGTNVAVTGCVPALGATLNQNQSMVCSYQQSGLDGTETTNTATALNANGAILGAGGASLDWSTPTDITDECIDVSDDKAGTLGTVCAPADLTGGQKTFQYTLDASNGGACGEYTNTASFITNDTDTTGQDSHTVNTTCAPPPITTQQNEPEPQVQEQPQPQGQQEVLGDRVTPGSARLGARTGCQGRPFTVRVKGRSISSVVFSIDGKRVKTVRAAGSNTTFTLKVDPRKFKPGSHKVVARVSFDPASGTPARSLATRFSRCVRAAQAPSFTG